MWQAITTYTYIPPSTTHPEDSNAPIRTCGPRVCGVHGTNGRGLASLLLPTHPIYRLLVFLPLLSHQNMPNSTGIKQNEQQYLSESRKSLFQLTSQPPSAREESRSENKMVLTHTTEDRAFDIQKELATF